MAQVIEHIFPIDVPSVMAYGLDRWEGEFFWPVSHLWFLSLESSLENMYISEIEKQEKAISDVLLTEFKLVLEFSNVLHSIKVFNDLCQKQKEILLSHEHSRHYKGLKKNQIPNEDLLHPMHISAPPLSSRLYNKARRIRRAVRFNKTSNLLKPSPAGLPVKVLNANYISNLYKEKLNTWADLIDYTEWFIGSPKYPETTDLCKQLEIVLDSIISQTCCIAKQHQIDLVSHQINYLKEVASKRILKAAEYYTVGSDRANRKKPIHLLGNAQGTTASRMLSLIVRNAGGKVTSFTHGTDTCRNIDRTLRWRQLATIDELVVGNSQIAQQYEKLNQRFPLLRKNTISYLPENSDFYYRYFREKQKIPLPSVIKSVMLISTSFRIDGRFASRLPDLNYIDVERRLTRFLSEAGFNVLYKKHPDGWMGGRPVQFLDSNITVIEEPFEEVMEETDAYLFYFSCTSCFGPALCTNKPIIYINENTTEFWFDEVYDLIKKRCRIVPGGFDKRNRIVYDEEALLAALATKPEEPNHEFVERFLFPDQY